MDRKMQEMRRYGVVPPKKKRSKKTEEKKEDRVKGVESREFMFEYDQDGLFTMDGNIRMGLSPYAQEAVSVGEIWDCMVDSNTIGRSVIPVRFVSKERPVEEGDGEDAVPGSSEYVPVMEMMVDAGDISDKGLRDELEMYKRTNRTLREKADRVDRLTRECESKDDEIKDLKVTVDSLKTQVRSLDEKDSLKELLSKESEIRSLNDAIESKDYEILKLREKLKSMGVDDMAVVPSMPRVPKVVLTGAESVHCSFLEDGMYSVLVCPNLGSIRVIRDDRGRIRCTDGTLHLRCISAFSRFEKARPLEFTDTGDMVEIRL